MLELCQIYARFMPELCQNYARFMLEFFENYARIIIIHWVGEFCSILLEYLLTMSRIIFDGESLIILKPQLMMSSLLFTISYLQLEL